MTNTVVFLALFLVIMLLVLGLYRASSRNLAMERRLRRLGGTGYEPVSDIPLWKSGISSISGVMGGRGKERSKLVDNMAAAGLYETWQTDAFLLARGALVLGALVIGWFHFEVDITTIFKNPFPILKCLVCVVIAARLPDFWLKGRIRQNREEIVKAVPQAIDFMSICVEAGLSLESSFQRVGEEMSQTSPELAAELRLTCSEMLLLDRMRALQRMKVRTGVREIEVLADALMQSMRFGTPLVETLQNLASEGRASQISGQEEKAGAISAKVGLPLILLVLFPLIVLLAAPSTVAFLRAL